ncbi:MAG: hypothetical protein FJ387_24235 [Verrucomicrobia bacterium]|nr:hypothetical protein [Verrucomicrobiota bacterium]
MNRRQILIILAVLLLPLLVEVPLYCRITRARKPPAATSPIPSAGPQVGAATPPVAERSLPPQPQASPREAGTPEERVLAEAHRSFSYHGKPIHPGLVREFVPWLSDSRPVVLAVDVTAAEDTNRYFAGSVTNLDRMVRLVEDPDPEDAAGRKPWFQYAHLGQLDDRTHVLEVARWGGGSGVFCSLLFVRFSIGQPRPDYVPGEVPLRLECAGWETLGDRWRGTLELRGDHVRVEAVDRQTGRPEPAADYRPWQ